MLAASFTTSDIPLGIADCEYSGYLVIKAKVCAQSRVQREGRERGEKRRKSVERKREIKGAEGGVEWGWEEDGQEERCIYPICGRVRARAERRATIIITPGYLRERATRKAATKSQRIH